MDCAADLHIHSCLSPCGDALMTPNNICRMALLKGLELIAVTDHNTARQLPAVEGVCREIGLNLLPGMELTTREEVHLLAYFRTVPEALAFSDALYPHLPDMPNRPAFFGEQQLMDAEDEPTGNEPRLLLSALDLGLDQLTGMILAAHGLPVPAHINRGSNGLLNVLGFLPPGAPYRALEVARHLPCPPLPDGPKRLHSSDAHRLEDIFEREVFLPLNQPTAEGFFAWIDGP
ncbi:PHP domain-containing protein [Bacillota bacterium Meth-B3]